MQITVIDGKLTFASVFRLVLAGCVLPFALLSAYAIVTAVAPAVMHGEINTGGRVARGLGPMAYELSFTIVAVLILAPIQACMLAAVLTCGVWIFNRGRPVVVAWHAGKAAG